MCPAARSARSRYTVTGGGLATLAVLIFAGVLLGGCAGGQAGGGASGGTGDTSGGTGIAPSVTTGGGATGGGTSPRVIDEGTVGGYGATGDTVVVARTDSDYRALERRVHSSSRGAAAWPRVDFNKNMVVAVFLAPGKGGESVHVDSVEAHGSDFVVRASHTVPGRNCIVAAVITHPFAVVQTVSLSGKPQLRLTTVTRDC